MKRIYIYRYVPTMISDDKYLEILHGYEFKNVAIW